MQALTDVTAALDDLEQQLHALRPQTRDHAGVDLARRQARELVVTAVVLIDRARAVFDQLDAKERCLLEVQRRSDAMAASLPFSTLAGL